ncbi:MAG: hypothetical protein M0Z73_13205 [Betaproteobacteria bacterium]|nr:hypothetical protein [Betaproteobacteria bacterium]
MTTNKKAATGGKAHAASRLHSTLNFISTSAWRLAFSLEEARRSHEAHGRHFRRLACCIAIAALRLLTGGLHHV